jgi:membrane protein DedA with SNARE-associated domain
MFSPAAFSAFVSAHPAFAYGLLFLGVFWEGELVLITAGILVHLGVLSLISTLAIVVAGGLAKTVVGYRVGWGIKRVFPRSRLLRHFERRVLYFLPRFKEEPFWSIFASKFIYGLNNAALVFAGFVGARFKTYFVAECISSTLWFGALFSLGYYFSKTAVSITHNVKTFLLIVLVFIIGFMLMQKVINTLIELVEEWQAHK